MRLFFALTKVLGLPKAATANLFCCEGVMQRFVKTEAVIVLCLFLLALILRLIGLDYGYFHGDERVNDAAKVLAGELVPGQHFYPPFINYLNAVALVGLFPVGLLAGWWDGAGAFRAAYFEDPTPFYLATRMMTALWGALLAPLFFLIARRLALSLPLSAAVGALGALFPLSVFMSHIAKSDAALATAMVACFGALLARMQAHHAKRWDIALGVCVALALSFKHSAIFVLLPLGLGWVVLLARQAGGGVALSSFLRALGVALVLWPIWNIGILLDLDNFLAYQKIQSVMSMQQDGWMVGLKELFMRSLELAFGIALPMTVAALVTPVLIWHAPGLPQRGTLMVIWGALTLGTLFTAMITGARQPEHLWIANFAGYLLLAAVTLSTVVQNARGALRWGAALWLLAGMGTAATGTAVVLSQAAAVTNQETLDQYIAQTHANRRIVTAAPLGLPQKKEAQAMELQRIERLAQKYNTEAPEIAPERLIQREDEGAVFYVNMPAVLFGLEGVEEGGEAYEVKAHTWPLQPEEWQLRYWTDQGIDLFVVRDFDWLAHQSEPEIRRNFLQNLDQACENLRSFAAVKPLFLEREIRVYDCAR
jgi:hypothetical protein